MGKEPRQCDSLFAFRKAWCAMGLLVAGVWLVVAQPVPAQEPRSVAIVDAVPRADHAIHGVVLLGEGFRSAEGVRDAVAASPASKPVSIGQARLLSRGRTPIIAPVASNGRFVLPVERSGAYLLEVRIGDAVLTKSCRVWSNSTAPRRSVATIVLSWEDATVVRGQSRRSETAKKTAFTAIAIGGAIATPAIYGALRDTEAIPLSP